MGEERLSREAWKRQVCGSYEVKDLRADDGGILPAIGPTRRVED